MVSSRGAFEDLHPAEVAEILVAHQILDEKLAALERGEAPPPDYDDPVLQRIQRDAAAGADPFDPARWR